ncbi:MAG: hypothetical protein JSV88_05110 [Candidatus Aminicenantes bacterium]|nr:MAG: hypothetical protein JSV88_05110 [Candidatus Aminicenantes bacterium]
MKKIALIFLCLICCTFHQSPHLQGKSFTGNGNNLEYRFDYTFQGEATGVLLFFFRYRFFFYARASALLTAKKIDEKTLQFNYIDIDKTGYLFRTWGFSGKTLITGAADYDLKKTRQILDKDFFIFKEKAPRYYRFIKRRKVFPFKILTRGKNVLTFKREINGIHRDCSLDMQLQNIKYERKYAFYFKIYQMLGEMLKIYNHSFFPGNCEKISELEPGMEWRSSVLDLSENINRIGARATDIIEKYVTFRQRSPFRLAYRVVSGTPGMLTIYGEAVPQVKIWDGFRIVRVTRTIQIRLPDGVVLEDKFYVEISKRKGKGGFAQCALTLIQ